MLPSLRFLPSFPGAKKAEEAEGWWRQEKTGGRAQAPDFLPWECPALPWAPPESKGNTDPHRNPPAQGAPGVRPSRAWSRVAMADWKHEHKNKI